MAGPGKNAMGSAMLRFLRERLEEAGGRPVLLTGSGDAFSSGLDLREVAFLDLAGMGAFLCLLDDAVERLFTYPGPTVALVNGHAIAGGCVLALACDHRVAGDAAGARIGLNEVANGLRYPPRILAMVRHRVPAPHAERVVLGAELLDPAGALRAGLLDEVSSGARLAAEARLAALAALPAAAYAAAKRDLRGAVMAPVPAEEERFAREGLPAWVDPALKARLLRVLEKR